LFILITTAFAPPLEHSGKNYLPHAQESVVELNSYDSLPCYDTYELTMLELIADLFSCEGFLCPYLYGAMFELAEQDFYNCINETY